MSNLSMTKFLESVFAKILSKLKELLMLQTLNSLIHSHVLFDKFFLFIFIFFFKKKILRKNYLDFSSFSYDNLVFVFFYNSMNSVSYAFLKIIFS